MKYINEQYFDNHKQTKVDIDNSNDTDGYIDIITRISTSQERCEDILPKLRLDLRFRKIFLSTRTWKSLSVLQDGITYHFRAIKNAQSSDESHVLTYDDKELNEHPLDTTEGWNEIYELLLSPKMNGRTILLDTLMHIPFKISKSFEFAKWYEDVKSLREVLYPLNVSTEVLTAEGGSGFYDQIVTFNCGEHSYTPGLQIPFWSDKTLKYLFVQVFKECSLEFVDSVKADTSCLPYHPANQLTAYPLFRMFHEHQHDDDGNSLSYTLLGYDENGGCENDVYVQLNPNISTEDNYTGIIGKYFLEHIEKNMNDADIARQITKRGHGNFNIFIVCEKPLTPKGKTSYCLRTRKNYGFFAVDYTFQFMNEKGMPYTGKQKSKMETYHFKLYDAQRRYRIDLQNGCISNLWQNI